MWLGTVFFQFENGSTGAHAVCLFRSKNGNLYWCDYSKPKLIEYQDFVSLNWASDVCKQFNAKPIAAGVTSVVRLTKSGRPVFGTQKQKIFTQTT